MLGSLNNLFHLCIVDHKHDIHTMKQIFTSTDGFHVSLTAGIVIGLLFVAVVITLKIAAEVRADRHKAARS